VPGCLITGRKSICWNTRRCWIRKKNHFLDSHLLKRGLSWSVWITCVCRGKILPVKNVCTSGSESAQISW
jgi:hypothetical protein